MLGMILQLLPHDIGNSILRFYDNDQTLVGDIFCRVGGKTVIGLEKWLEL